MSLTYVALKRLKVGNEYRIPGELVPEAKEWRNRASWINTGHIAPVEEPALENETVVEPADSEPETPVVVPSVDVVGEDAPVEFTDLREKSMDEIRELVTSGEVTPEDAYVSEQKRDPSRSTLITWLENYEG